MFRPDLLSGKRILVTGGGSGLGRDIASKYAALGADVYICGRRAAVLGETAAQLMAEHGRQVKYRALDIRDGDEVDALVEWIWEDGGPLDGLVNNAAGNFVSRTQDLSRRGFDAIADIVLHGTFYVTHAVGRRWIAEGRRGSIVSIVVTWVRTGAPFVVPSAMSKAGIDAMTKSLAVEWGPHGIRLNAIAPGIFPDGRRQQPAQSEGGVARRHRAQSDEPGRAHRGAAEPRRVPDGRRRGVAERRDDRHRRRRDTCRTARPSPTSPISAASNGAR